MQLHFTYDRKKVLQALRYHFIWQPEIKILLIVVIVFDIISAILYAIGKVRPEPFLLGSFIWLLVIISLWYIIPVSLYKKNHTFHDNFLIDFNNGAVTIQNERGSTQWEWSRFVKYFESPHFFHLYFSSKAFFLVPKDNMDEIFIQNLRLMLKEKITSTK
ncbi:hypothetical protein BH11BAC6_BH11BAC6_12060 [soil metagenome]